MIHVETRKIEDQLDRKLLFNVRLCDAKASPGQRDLEFPIGIIDRGSAGANETAVLSAALGLAEELATTLRRQLESAPRG